MNGTIVVCTSDIEPFVSCANPADPGGLDIEVFRAIAAVGNYDEGIHYSLVCAENFDDMLRRVENCECTVGIGSVTPTLERTMYNGIQFSLPYLPTSLALLTRTDATSNMWTFTEPFDLSVWILVFFTAGVMFPLAQLLLRAIAGETVAECARALPDVSLRGMHAVLGNADTGAPELLPDEEDDTKLDRKGALVARALFVVYGFFCLVIGSLYTANLAAFATVSSLRPAVKSLGDLMRPDVKILANEIYASALRGRYGISTVPWGKFDGSDSVVESVAMLETGSLDGIITDRGVLAWAAKRATQCTVSMVDHSSLKYFGISMAWSPCAPRSLVEEFDMNILRLSDNGELERITRGTLGSLFDVVVGCSTVAAAECTSGTNSVGLEHIAGLWIILASATGAALLYVGISRFFTRRRSKSKSSVAASP